MFVSCLARSRAAIVRFAVATAHSGRTTSRLRLRSKHRKAAYPNTLGTKGFAITIGASDADV